MNSRQLEEAAEQRASLLRASLARDRKILTLADLLAGSNHKMRFEQAFPQVRDEQGKLAHFYTVDLILDHVMVQGAMLAGSCALVFARTRRQADDLAMEGLQTTLTAGFEYVHGVDNSAVIAPELEFGGTRGDPAPVSNDTLRSDPRTREVLRDRFGKKKAH